jgi:HD-like signal output (HDOD) protein
VVTAATETLRTIESRPRYAPRRPELLPQLLEALSSDASTLRDMAAIIARDPALTGNLLRIANSPLYRVNARPIESIDRAMVMIGVDGMRAIIAAALFQPVLEVQGEFARVPALIWEHTLYSAAAAETHAARIGRTDPFAAQLLALVLGLGTIVTLSVVLDEYAARPGTPPDAGVTVAILDSWSGPTAQRIAASWGLSDRIGDALNEQLLDGGSSDISALGQSLRFGRMSAALAMLVAAGQFPEEEALIALGSQSVNGQEVRHIWDRLRKRPQD